MDATFYKGLIARAAFGYAYHRTIFDETGRIIDFEFVEVNEMFEQLTGLKAEDLIGRRITEITPKGSEAALEIVECYWDTALFGTSGCFEQYIRPLDKWYNVQVSLHEEVFLSVIFMDITKSKLTELTIQAANNRIQRQRAGVIDLLLNPAVVSGDITAAAPFLTSILARVMQVARASIWLLAENNTELHCIDLYEAGLQRHTVGTILYREDFPKYFQTLQQETRIYANDAQSDPRTKEFNNIYHKPLGIMALLDAGIIVNGKVVGVVCLEHIGTKREWYADEESFSSTAAAVAAQVLLNFERTRAEQELRQSEERFRDVVDAMGEAVFELDDTLEITYISAKIDDILGFPPNWFIGKNPMEYIHEEDRAFVLTAVGRAMQEGGTLRELEHRMYTKDGNSVWLCANSSALVNPQGRFMGFRGTLSDITLRRSAQEETLRRQAAEAANQAKSQFLANMSHEIRTPLNAVIGFTDLLRTTPLDPIQQQYVQNAHTSAHSLLGIINDILDFSKIEAGKLELDISKIDIIALVEETSDIIKYASAQKGLELLVNIPVELPRFAWVDGVRLKQILVNLLSNAVKFTHTGEVELSLRFDATNGRQGRYRFAVRDTGIGIRPEEQSRLFQAFAQADSSTTRRFGGTGLGLTISNMLAEKMGRPIEINSKLGAGSTFAFELIAEYQNGDRRPTDAIQHINAVLVVDDNDNNRLILQHIFEHWGIGFKGCSSGQEALQLIAQENFDVLIVDYNMPDLDGIETIRRVRESQAQAQRRQPLVLLHSSSDDDNLHKACRELGVSNRLVKPVKIEELYQSLTSLIFRAPEPHLLRQPSSDIADSLHSLSPTILVAEDVAINRLLIKKVIQQLIPKVQIVEAQDGNEALYEAGRRDIDLIFMDVQMPNKDGYTCTQDIRRMEALRPDRPRLPIVALTAGAIQEDKDRCLSVGMDDFLTKPIDKAALIEVLARYLA